MSRRPDSTIDGYASSADPKPKQPETPPLDDAMAFSRYSSKYDVTFYGATQAEADQKLLDADVKRNGERHKNIKLGAWRGE